MDDTAGADWSGQTHGDFEVQRLLGQGGMGRVYLARQISLDRLVALKVVRSDARSREELGRRLRSEALTVARLNHPNIVQVHAICDLVNSPTLVMEYIDGKTLKDLVERRGVLDAGECIHFLEQVGSALAHAHDAGFIHRDIKPENILVTRQGVAKVGDFGLARLLDRRDQSMNLTQDGAALGTPLYMSPEQVEGKRLDSRSDLYSLGVTAYFMLAGHPPFQGTSPLEIAVKQVRADPAALAIERPDVPVPLCDLIHKMLKKNPSERPDSPAGFLKELQAVSGESKPAGFWRLLPRNRIATAAMACVGGLLAILSGAGLAVLRTIAEESMASNMMSRSVPDNAVEENSSSPKVSSEAALRQAVDIYLSGKVEGATIDAGIVVCLDLGLMYLQQERWEEALKFFERLDQPKQALHFQALGKLGSGIALAMENRPTDSVGSFRELGPLWRDEILRERAWRNALDIQPQRRPARMPGSPPDQTPLRFWLGRAIEANRRNGLPDSDIPPILKRLASDPAVTRIPRP